MSEKETKKELTEERVREIAREEIEKWHQDNHAMLSKD